MHVEHRDVDGRPLGPRTAAVEVLNVIRPTVAISWYVAFAAFKLAVILEGVHARYLAGGTVGDGYAHAGPAVGDLATRALALLN